MVIHAISLYDAVLFVHILAVVVAFGVTFTYGLLDACARRAGIADMVALHRFQVFLSRLLLTPAMVVVLVAASIAPSTAPTSSAIRGSARRSCCSCTSSPWWSRSA